VCYLTVLSHDEIDIRRRGGFRVVPLGTAAAIEFLGPLGAAAIRSHRRSALAWPALALAG